MAGPTSYPSKRRAPRALAASIVALASVLLASYAVYAAVRHARQSGQGSLSISGALRVPLRPGVHGYTDASKSTADTLAGASECGAHITAVETAGTSVGSTYPAAGTFTVGSTGSFSGFGVDAIKGVGQGAPFGYDVTATDLAGNATTVSIAGTDTA